MFSCTEYLLCGLPVVTTPNRGGRNRYLTPETSTSVAPDPHAIRTAVDRYCQSPPNLDTIREITLNLMRRDRAAFVELLNRFGATRTADSHSEMERIWGTEQGIETLAIPLADIPNRLG